MPVMSDIWIRKMATEHGMIEPFVESQKRDGVISYGLSSYGYDARAADQFKIFTNVDSAVVDPKQFNPESFVDRQTPVCVIVNVTPLEPEWEGQVTIEISNTTPLPAKIYANEGICQFLFLHGNEPCETSYADKAGKYMHQRGVALPRLG